MFQDHQRQSPPTRILLVKGDPLLQEMFGCTLALQDYEVRTASDGLNAVRKVREGRYDLVDKLHAPRVAAP